MVTRIKQLFQRYVITHGFLDQPIFPLIDSDGEVFGYLEKINLRYGRIVVEGWAKADVVGLSCGIEHNRKAPFLTRDDVTQQYDIAGYITPGFSLDLPLNHGHIRFFASRGDTKYIFLLPNFSPRDLAKMRTRLMLPFLRDVVRALPAARSWYVHRDPLARARIKSILRLDAGQAPTLFLPSDLFADAGVVPMLPQDTAITIIVPIYNSISLLKEALQRVIEHTDLPYRLILIEDASTDTNVRPFIRCWKAELPRDLAVRVHVIENEVNLGFVRSVNKGLEAALSYGNHVVILNADAFVPASWASRLIGPILIYSDVASVTPMSNDAEIFNVPNMGKPADLSPGQGDAMDRVAALLNPAMTLAEAPTGVGFCMAININYLRLEPQFDTVFGQGYGEEVDWCRRVKQRHGGRHMGLAGLFVEHCGGSSFGSAEKLQLVRMHNKIISGRYPQYDQLVQDFILNDPLGSSRLALGVAWAGLRHEKAVPVYLAHSLGGGAENYLQRRIHEGLNNKRQEAALILRVGGVQPWQIELYTLHGLLRGETDDESLLKQLLDLLPMRQMVYSCGVGAHNPIEIPRLLTELASGPTHSLEVLFHDFLPLSPSYTLLDHDGIYRGVPKACGSEDIAHHSIAPSGQRLSLSNWRSAWGRMLQEAEHLTVFSTNSAKLVSEAYPQFASRIRIRPHKLLNHVPRISQKETAKPVIGVLGNIGIQKGARVLQKLSRLLAEEGHIRLVVIGNIDPAYGLVPPAIIHGSYRPEEIAGLVSRYKIDRWLIPSVWPETFSYTTHEALATGLPVFAFDLGAHGDAVNNSIKIKGQGGVIPLDCLEDIEKLLRIITEPQFDCTERSGNDG